LVKDASCPDEAEGLVAVIVVNIIVVCENVLVTVLVEEYEVWLVKL